MQAKHVVITGGTKGIGLGLARSFLNLGCTLTICSRSQEHLDKALSILENSYSPDRYLGLTCDVTKPREVQDLWIQSIKRFKKVDVWINNAGMGQPYKNIWELEPEFIHNITATNISGMIIGSQVAFKGMMDQGFGKIFNMEGFGSSGMKRPRLSVYGTTKSALTYFTRSMIKEMGSSPVILGTISPGMVVTDLLLQPVAKENPEYKTTLRVFNLMANTVESVTPWLAQKVLKTKKQGARIRYNTPFKFIFRFLKNLLTNRKIIPEV